VATNASQKKKKKIKEILAMKNKPFEHGTVINTLRAGDADLLF